MLISVVGERISAAHAPPQLIVLEQAESAPRRLVDAPSVVVHREPGARRGSHDDERFHCTKPTSFHTLAPPAAAASQIASTAAARTPEHIERTSSQVSRTAPHHRRPAAAQARARKQRRQGRGQCRARPAHRRRRVAQRHRTEAATPPHTVSTGSCAGCSGPWRRAPPGTWSRGIARPAERSATGSMGGRGR